MIRFLLILTAAVILLAAFRSRIFEKADDWPEYNGNGSPSHPLIAKQQNRGNKATTGADLTKLNCAACHGNDRCGNHDGSYPSLIGVGSKMSGEKPHDL